MHPFGSWPHNRPIGSSFAPRSLACKSNFRAEQPDNATGPIVFTTRRAHTAKGFGRPWDTTTVLRGTLSSRTQAGFSGIIFRVELFVAIFSCFPFRPRNRMIVSVSRHRCDPVARIFFFVIRRLFQSAYARVRVMSHGEDCRLVGVVSGSVIDGGSTTAYAKCLRCATINYLPRYV